MFSKKSQQEVVEYVRLWEAIISEISLTPNTEDKITWRWTEHEEYTAQSAYIQPKKKKSRQNGKPKLSPNTALHYYIKIPHRQQLKQTKLATRSNLQIMWGKTGDSNSSLQGLSFHKASIRTNKTVVGALGLSILKT
jgi:hypothetical protein